MDCNKEEALKALQIAENKILSQDYSGAKKFILKAQRLYSKLPGFPQLLAVVDVHSNAIATLGDLDVNWYRIFQLDPWAHKETVQKRYKKLLLMLHPDKNKYAGAASAFKIVTDAWASFLKGVGREKGSSSQQGVDDDAHCHEAAQEKPASSFSIMCKNPSEHSKYFKELHNGMGCMLCMQPFGPTKRNRTVRGSLSKKATMDAKGCASGDDGSDGHDDAKDGASSDDGHDGGYDHKKRVHVKTLPTRGNRARGGALVKSHTSTYEGSKEETGANGKRARGSSKTDRGSVDFNESSFFEGLKKKTETVFGNLEQKNKTGKDPQGEWKAQRTGLTKRRSSRNKRKATDSPLSDPEIKSNSGAQGTETLSREDNQGIKDRLFKKAKSHILKGFNKEKIHDIEIKQENEQRDVASTSGQCKAIHIKLSIRFTLPTSHEHVTDVKFKDTTSVVDCKEKSSDNKDHKMSDSDVYDFNKDRQEECFEAGQIWALYDDDDELPRYYARVTEVLSIHPFHVQMKWLYPSKSISTDVQLWIDSGLAYTCGEYKVGRVLKRSSVVMFSHVMTYEKGRNGPIKIYPRKGDVWALYKTWKPSKGMTHDCEPVEVMSHYSEEEAGVKVAPIFRVKGFKSIFCRAEPEVFTFIPKEELTRFSHQIPAHHLAGYEAPGLPKNCLDLDTAAISLD